jgi:hypothetical protein
MFRGLSVAILAPFVLLVAPQSSFEAIIQLFFAADNISLSRKRE